MSMIASWIVCLVLALVLMRMLQSPRRWLVKLLTAGLIVAFASVFYTSLSHSQSDSNIPASHSTGQVSVRQYNAEDRDPRIAEAANAFGMKLYSALSEAGEGRNLWLSPLSVSTALALAYNGASGAAAGAMAGGLGLSALTQDEAAQGYRVLLDALNHPLDEKIRLSVADSLWLRQGYKLLDGYVRESRDSFGADVQTLDFERKTEALRTMNDWVKAHTNGKIEKIVSDIDPETRLFILNAVAFQGAWTDPFVKTDDAEFHVTPEKSVTVPMIRNGGRFEYADADAYEAIRLPLGKNGADSLVIVLPKPGVALQAVRQAVAADPGLLTRSFESRQGQIAMPKFRVEYEAALKDALTALGMGEAFDPDRASFARMMAEPPNLYIGEVMHKTYLSVDENGVEADAATEVMMAAGAAPPQDDPFDMIVDRPFIAAITDNETNALLFVGTIVEPA